MINHSDTSKNTINNALFEAAESNEVGSATTLLEKGADISFVPAKYDKKKIMHNAWSIASKNLINLEKLRNPNPPFHTPLSLAVFYNRLNIVRFFFDKILMTKKDETPHPDNSVYYNRRKDKSTSSITHYYIDPYSPLWVKYEDNRGEHHVTPLIFYTFHTKDKTKYLDKDMFIYLLPKYNSLDSLDGVRLLDLDAELKAISEETRLEMFQLVFMKRATKIPPIDFAISINDIELLKHFYQTKNHDGFELDFLAGLHKAISGSYINMLTTLLKRKMVDINSIDNDGKTVLWFTLDLYSSAVVTPYADYARAASYIEIIARLLHSGADPDIKFQDETIAQKIISLNKHSNFILRIKGHTVYTLINYLIICEIRLSKRLSSVGIELLKSISEHNVGELQDLYHIASIGDCVNFYPLHYMTSHGIKANMGRLLRQKLFSVNSKNQTGQTALWIAVDMYKRNIGRVSLWNRRSIIKVLLSHQANSNMLFGNKTMLQNALEWKDDNLVNLFLTHKAQFQNPLSPQEEAFIKKTIRERKAQQLLSYIENNGLDKNTEFKSDENDTPETLTAYALRHDMNISKMLLLTHKAQFQNPLSPQR